MSAHAQIDSIIIYQEKLQYERAINYLERTIEKNDYKFEDMSKAIDYHNLACIYSLNKQSDKCIETLNLIVQYNLDYSDFYMDPDFYYVSNQKDEWKKFLIQYKNAKKLNFQDTIFIDLCKIAINDQALFKEISIYEQGNFKNAAKASLLYHIKDSLNKENLKLVNYYYAKGYNILSDSVVGKFSKKCFMVIQHSDLKTMEKYLPVIKKLYECKQTKGGNYALLYDRISVDKNNGIQYYGTQINAKTNKPYFIKDVYNVDKRRKELGMEPLSEYLERFDIIYKPK